MTREETDSYAALYTAKYSASGTARSLTALQSGGEYVREPHVQRGMRPNLAGTSGRTHAQEGDVEGREGGDVDCRQEEAKDAFKEPEHGERRVGAALSR